MTQQQALRDYLLGRLPEEASAAFDARLFAGDALQHELAQEQESLIEDLVYGRLTAEEEMGFELQCDRSPLLRQKVQSFRNFLAALERQAEGAPARVLRWERMLAFASPALALLLCCASFLYLREVRRNATLASRPNAPLTEQAGSTVVAFLSANVPRGPSSEPVIPLKITATVLELQVELHAQVDDKDWDVELLRGSEVISSVAHVPVQRVGQEVFLRLLIDATSLRPDSYVIRYAPHAHPDETRSRGFHVRAAGR